MDKYLDKLLIIFIIILVAIIFGYTLRLYHEDKI